MKKVLCIGQVAYDITLLVDHYPEENKKMRVNEKVECAGGSAFNSAYLLKTWEVDASFIGSIGKDYYGSKIQQEAQEIALPCFFHETDMTTTSYIITNVSTGSRTILTNKNKSAIYQGKIPEEKYDMLVLDSNEVELSLKMLEKYPNVISILDAGKLCDEVLTLGKKVDYFVCSKDFAEKFTNLSLQGDEDYRKAYDLIKEHFQNKVIITLEEKGCFTKLEDYVLVPSIPVKSVDSTGAGDIYHGALAYFILEDYPLLDAMRYANIAGALSVTKIGSKASQPQKEEVLKQGRNNAAF